MENFDIKQLPAFPVNMSGPCTFAGVDIPKGGVVEWSGISIRDYFAAKAMQMKFGKVGATMDFESMADCCYQMADAMLKARG